MKLFDFRKVDTVTMTHIHRIDPASFITTLNLLKGCWQGSLTPRASKISLLRAMITSANEQGFRTGFRAPTCIWMMLCCTPVRRLSLEQLAAANLILGILASASSRKPLGLFWKNRWGMAKYAKWMPRTQQWIILSPLGLQHMTPQAEGWSEWLMNNGKWSWCKQI